MERYNFCLHKMRAVELVSQRQMELREVDRPAEPGPGEVLVKLQSIGICGSDLHYYLDGRVGDRVVQYPAVLGHEPVGEVVALGPGVSEVRPGQTVCVEPAVTCGHCEFCISGRSNLCLHIRFMGGREGPGFFRDYAIMPVRNLELVPDTITPIEAVLVEPVGVIVHMMKLAPVRVGDTVLVVGAGPIGLLTVVLSKLAGAAQVIAGDRVPHRVDMAKRMGADIGVQMPRESIVDAVMDLTRRRGADIIYDAVGSSETIDASLHAARRGAQYVLLGLPYEVRPTVDVHLAMEKEIRIVTVRRGNHSGHEAMALIEAGKIPASLITHRIPLEATPDAFAMLAAYRDGVGKIVIEA